VNGHTHVGQHVGNGVHGAGIYSPRSLFWSNYSPSKDENKKLSPLSKFNGDNNNMLRDVIYPITRDPEQPQQQHGSLTINTEDLLTLDSGNEQKSSSTPKVNGYHTPTEKIASPIKQKQKTKVKSKILNGTSPITNGYEGSNNHLDLNGPKQNKKIIKSPGNGNDDDKNLLDMSLPLEELR